MIVVRFKSNEDHYDLIKKVKKMKKFTEELEECLEDAMENDDYDFRGSSYRHEYEEEEEPKMEGRYGYRRGSYRMGR
jgi:hypothetical protein